MYFLQPKKALVKKPDWARIWRGKIKMSSIDVSWTASPQLSFSHQIWVFWPSSEVFTGKVAYFSGLIYYLITTIFETTQTTAIEATTFRCSGFICKGNLGLFSNHQRQQL